MKLGEHERKSAKIHEHLGKPGKHLRKSAKFSEKPRTSGETWGKSVELREIPRKAAKFREKPQATIQSVGCLAGGFLDPSDSGHGAPRLPLGVRGGRLGGRCHRPRRRCRPPSTVCVCVCVHTSGEPAFYRTLALVFGASPADFAAFRAAFEGFSDGVEGFQAKLKGF